MWICRGCGRRNEDGSTSCSCGQDGSTCESCGAPAKAGRCEACERAMADAPPPGRLTRVWSCTNPSEAELLRVELRRAGIESVLDNVGGASFAIGMGTAAIPFGITVSEDDARRALEILQAEASRGPSEVYIPPVVMIKFPCGCGKELEVPPDFQGLEMDCPYCGRPVRAS
ncbi:MAG TPA: DUF2007 domain-containing protein [Planctomycetota bacterium]